MNESLNEQQKANVYLGEQVNMMNESLNEQQKDINRLPPSDCKALLQAGNVESGIYYLLKDGRIFKVYCDMVTSGGGWTVFQRRCDGTQDFSLGWNEYRRGFGKKEGEFWMGLDDLHSLLSNGRFQLRIDMTACNNQSFFAEYRSFNVLGSSTNYQLQIGDFEGSPGLRNYMKYVNGRPFSTIDRDNDDSSTTNCAKRHGAWWYWRCGNAFLNGGYSCSSPNWWNGSGFISVRFSEMKFRPY
uniref:Fibrinogen C-terminal domain-containing protein n=1 Tax=Ciona savignyi TaxID=51511 RepID=H2Y8G7_CIOSA